jgi:hypothetical protein
MTTGTRVSEGRFLAVHSTHYPATHPSQLRTSFTANVVAGHAAWRLLSTPRGRYMLFWSLGFSAVRLPLGFRTTVPHKISNRNERRAIRERAR